MVQKLTQQIVDAKQIGSAAPLGMAAADLLAKRQAEFPEFAWLGEMLTAVKPYALRAARLLVELHGEDPRGPQVASALGITEQDVRERLRFADVERRVKRSGGQAPPGKSLEERWQHVFVKRALLPFLVRMSKPTPRLPNGTKIGSTAAALLARAGVLEAETGGDSLEPHPRAKPLKVRKLEPARRQQIDAELMAMSRGEWGRGESTRPLPDRDRMCGASRRNHRRAAEARELYDAQARIYTRKQKLERLAEKVGGRFRNPDGVKPLPLLEGRKAREVARHREKAAAFLHGLPHEIRVRLHDAATRGGERGRFSREALRVYAFYAYLLWQSCDARPSMQRSGYARAVEGLSREALAVAFVWNEYFEAPFCANTISSLARTLADAGLIGREQPNTQLDVYTGTTGWALYVYRIRSGLQLADLARSLGEEVAPAAAEVGGPTLVEEAPS